MSCTSVDLPEPVPPRMPIVSPDLIFRFMSERVARSARSEYLKLTLANSTEPSGTTVFGFLGFFIAGSSSSTPTIRRAEVADMVIITYIAASDMSEKSIWAP